MAVNIIEKVLFMQVLFFSWKCWAGLYGPIQETRERFLHFPHKRKKERRAKQMIEAASIMLTIIFRSSEGSQETKQLKFLCDRKKDVFSLLLYIFPFWEILGGRRLHAPSAGRGVVQGRTGISAWDSVVRSTNARHGRRTGIWWSLSQAHRGRPLASKL